MRDAIAEQSCGHFQNDTTTPEATADCRLHYSQDTCLLAWSPTFNNNSASIAPNLTAKWILIDRLLLTAQSRKKRRTQKQETVIKKGWFHKSGSFLSFSSVKESINDAIGWKVVDWDHRLYAKQAFNETEVGMGLVAINQNQRELKPILLSTEASTGSIKISVPLAWSHATHM